jgi:hypothetical protein
MASNPDQDKKVEQIRTQIENLAREGLVLEAIEGGIQSYSAHLPAHRSSRSLFPWGGSSCSKTDILVLSGRDRTDNAGIAKVSVNSLLCGVVSEGLASNATYVMIREPNFVATPHGSLPSFATVVTNSTIRQISNAFLMDRDGNPLPNRTALDVTVDVRTWKHDGSPAASTFFSWICTVEAVRSVFIGG